MGGHRRAGRGHRRGGAPRGRVRAHGDALARPLAGQFPLRDAGRRVRPADRPHRGLLARRVPPGLRRRPGSLRDGQRGDRRRRLRAPPQGAAEGDRDPGDQGPSQAGHGRGLRTGRARSAHGARGGRPLLRRRPPGGGRAALSGGIFRARGAPGTVRLDGHHGQDQARWRGRRDAQRHPALPPRRRHLPPRAGEDEPHPALRGAGGRDVRQGQDRRLPPPLHRRGGHGGGRHPGAARHGLPDVHLPRARPGHRPRHPAGGRDGRALRARGRLLGRPRRLHAPLRPRAALPRRVRDRGRQPSAVRRRGPGRRLHRLGGRDPLDDGRRRHQPGHLRRDHEPGRALEAPGGVPDHQQPVRDGHRPPPPLGGHRPLAQVRGLRRARHAMRRHGRAGRARGGDQGAGLRPRGAKAPAGGGRDLPLPRALHGRPRGVPHQGGGGGVARARPDRHLLQAHGGAGRDETGGRGGHRQAGRGHRGRGREVRRPVPLPGPRLPLRRRVRVLRRRARLVDGGRALPRGAPRRARARGGPGSARAGRAGRGLRLRGRRGGPQPPQPEGRGGEGEGEPASDEPEAEGGAD